MSRVEALNQRYAATAALVRDKVEVVVIGDSAGARLNSAVQQLVGASRDEGEVWADLVGAIKALRWRLVTQPQPLGFNPALRDGVKHVIEQVERLRGAVAQNALLNEIRGAAEGILESDPPVGGVLRRSIIEVGSGACLVVVAGAASRAGLKGWLGNLGIRVLTAGDLGRELPNAGQAYVVGPPRFFPSSLVTAPVTTEVSFVLPGWFRDRSIPHSVISQFAEGAVRVEARIHIEGDTAEPISPPAEAEIGEDFFPQPSWSRPEASGREPQVDEVEVRKVLLSGSLAMWLDDGERIRSLDPLQPEGERVTYVPVTAVQVGTYLLLRNGETERGALYRSALELLGPRSELVDASQRDWKGRLAAQVSTFGYRLVVARLEQAGVRTAERARAWTDPSLIRPNSDIDFERLLGWLGVPLQPTFGHAVALRKAIYQASAGIREELEAAVGASDLSKLEVDGRLSLDIDTEGFRGIVATRVLAISPHAEVVPRREARRPFEDKSGQWLE